MTTQENIRNLEWLATMLAECAHPDAPAKLAECEAALAEARAKLAAEVTA